MAKLNLPGVLVFVVVSTGAAVGVTCGDGGTNNNTADAGQNCAYTCVRANPADAGPGNDAGVICPACANGMGKCPSGCEPIPLA
jgi:hypothetical protein